jgi:hypothetical protein
MNKKRTEKTTNYTYFVCPQPKNKEKQQITQIARMFLIFRMG